jgi:hypothetical protein
MSGAVTFLERLQAYRSSQGTNVIDHVKAQKCEQKAGKG